MNEDLWVFGYGSLMWRPGFEFVERQPALLRGLHRSLCIYSYVHRGTEARPGIVAGLDRGGACRGMAFRVEASVREPVLDYLREREQMNYCYKETYRTVLLPGQPKSRTVTALSFVVDRTHTQYCGALDLEAKADLVRQGIGQSGTSRDYLKTLVESLGGLGIYDEGLVRLMSFVTNATPEKARVDSAPTEV